MTEGCELKMCAYRNGGKAHLANDEDKSGASFRGTAVGGLSRGFLRGFLNPRRLLIPVFMLLAFSSSNVSAGEYVGQLCLTQAVGGESVELRLSVTSVGDGNFLLNGTGPNMENSGVASIIGNAVVVGNRVLLTLQKSHAGEYGLSVSTIHCDLSASTLSGTFHQMSQDYSGGFEPLAYGTGTASLAQCD